MGPFTSSVWISVAGPAPRPGVLLELPEIRHKVPWKPVRITIRPSSSIHRGGPQRIASRDRDLYTNGPSSFIHNNPKVERTHASPSR